MEVMRLSFNHFSVATLSLSLSQFQSNYFSPGLCSLHHVDLMNLLRARMVKFSIEKKQNLSRNSPHQFLVQLSNVVQSFEHHRNLRAPVQLFFLCAPFNFSIVRSTTMWKQHRSTLTVNKTSTHGAVGVAGKGKLIDKSEHTKKISRRIVDEWQNEDFPSHFDLFSIVMRGIFTTQQCR